MVRSRRAADPREFLFCSCIHAKASHWHRYASLRLVIHGVEARGDLRMYGGNVNRLTHSVIVQPEIRSIEQLHGKVIGVSALNAGTSSLFMDLLARHGLGRADYSMVVAGAVPPRQDLLLQRTIDAAMQTDPHNYMAEDAGLRNQGLFSEWIPYCQFTCVAARKHLG